MSTRHHHLALEPEDEPGLDIASLIDVSFLLLIYFIVTTTLEKRELDLGLELPASQPSDQPFKVDPLMIEVDDQGQISVNKEVVEPPGSGRTLPQLLERLKSYAELARATDNKALIIVAADDAAEQQRFVDVMNALAEVGITHITLTGFQEN